MNSVARLAGEEPRRFEDNEGTIEQLRARRARTNDFLKKRPRECTAGIGDARDQAADRRARA
jgi:hypothetical protein